MAKIITRFFDDVADAKRARDELVKQGQLSRRIISLFDTADGLEDALTAAHVAPETASAYAKRMSGGSGSVVMVKAGYKPLGVAKIARRTLAAAGAADMGDLAQEVRLPDGPPKSIMDDHPLMMSRERDPEDTNYHMADWPIPLISRAKPFDFALFPKHARMASWPFPLISHGEPFTFSLFDHHARMANWPIPLISHRKPYTASAIPRHGRMANFPIPLISQRKPYTGSLIPKHQRMANWPFPHLINGKTGTNALIPGNPRMANFPIGLLSQRKPFTGSIFSRHARMASFPIGLISHRKPYTGSIVPKHGRMADRFLPLISNFSFSKLFGLPTLSSR